MSLYNCDNDNDSDNDNDDNDNDNDNDIYIYIYICVCRSWTNVACQWFIFNVAQWECAREDEERVGLEYQITAGEATATARIVTIIKKW